MPIGGILYILLYIINKIVKSLKIRLDIKYWHV
jgi:hypothetical protein